MGDAIGASGGGGMGDAGVRAADRGAADTGVRARGGADETGVRGRVGAAERGVRITSLSLSLSRLKDGETADNAAVTLL